MLIKWPLGYLMLIFPSPHSCFYLTSSNRIDPVRCTVEVPRSRHRLEVPASAFITYALTPGLGLLLWGLSLLPPLCPPRDVSPAQELYSSPSQFLAVRGERQGQLLRNKWTDATASADCSYLNLRPMEHHSEVSCPFTSHSMRSLRFSGIWKPSAASLLIFHRLLEGAFDIHLTVADLGPKHSKCPEKKPALFFPSLVAYLQVLSLQEAACSPL